LTLEDCTIHQALEGKVAVQEVEAVGAVMICTDVTEERERRIRLSELTYAGIVSMAFDAMISVDGEQRIQHFTSGA
jgi:hypothetical protein